MNSKTAVDNFISKKNLAIVGVSRSGKKFGNTVNKSLKEKGYTTFIVNPNSDSIDGQTSYPDFKSIPRKIEGVLICVPPAQTELVVKDAHETGINNVWMQLGAQSEKAIKYCEGNNINYVANECILMFAEPVTGAHKFHRWVWKIFGKLPK